MPKDENRVVEEICADFNIHKLRMLTDFPSLLNMRRYAYSDDIDEQIKCCENELEIIRTLRVQYPFLKNRSTTREMLCQITAQEISKEPSSYVDSQIDFIPEYAKKLIKEAK